MLLLKYYTQYASKFEKLNSATGLETVIFHSNPKERQCPPKCSNYCTITLILHTFKVILNILQVRLQQYMDLEFPDVQAGFRKGRGTRDQIANIQWIIEKSREFQFSSVQFSPVAQSCLTLCDPMNWESSRKTSNSALLIMPKPFTV